MEIHLFFGILATAISVGGTIPYILSILKGRTKPNRASWFIWLAVGLLMFASYWSVGARESVWITLPIGVTVVAALSLRYGVGGWTVFDRACLALAFAGLFLWWLSDLAISALVFAMLADIIGYLPTIRKVLREPHSEDKLAWSMYCIGALVNLLAIINWAPEIAAYPICLAFFNTGVFALLFRSTSQKTKNMA